MLVNWTFGVCVCVFWLFVTYFLKILFDFILQCHSESPEQLVFKKLPHWNWCVPLASPLLNSVFQFNCILLCFCFNRKFRCLGAEKEFCPVGTTGKASVFPWKGNIFLHCRFIGKRTSGTGNLDSVIYVTVLNFPLTFFTHCMLLHKSSTLSYKHFLYEQVLNKM